MDLIYFGSSSFSVPFLEHLDDSSHRITGVFTYRDKERGRGLKLSPNPVKECAAARKLPLYEIESFDDDLYGELSHIRFDYAVVVSFGMILPREIFERWPEIWLNVHPSLLPAYRGPSPMISALLDGAVTTGVTINSVVYEVDTGKIYAQTAFNIDRKDNLDSLQQKVVTLGAPLLVAVLDLIGNHDYRPVPQPKEGITYTAKITAEDLVIDWTRPAEEVFNRIRAFSSCPGAYTIFNGSRLKILAAHTEDHYIPGESPGTVVRAGGRDGIVVACGSGTAISLDTVQPQGKRPMDAASFINGYRISAGIVLGKE